MSSRRYYLNRFQSYLFIAFIFWVIVSIISFRLYATSKLTEASGIISNFSKPSTVCAEYDETLHAPTYVEPYTKIAKKYELNRSKNLINDSQLSKIKDNKPLHYSSDLADQHSNKIVEADVHGNNFLRVERSSSDGESGSGWQPKQTAIKTGAYYYSFEYRNSAKADVTIEFTKTSGEKEYRGITILETSGYWKFVQGHIQNYEAKYNSMRITVSIHDSGYLDIRRPEISKLNDIKFDEPIISVAFDDGWRNIYDRAYPLLEKYDIDSTQFIVSELSKRKDPKYMDFDQIREMAATGHEIASHSLNHCAQPGLGQENLIKDSRKSAEILAEEGFDQKGGFAYPYGSYNQETQGNKTRNHSYIRTTDDGYNDSYFDISKLKTKNIYSDTKLPEILSWIRHAKENNLWLILVYHQIDDNGKFSNSVKTFENHLKLIKNNNVKTLTVQQAIEQLNKM